MSEKIFLGFYGKENIRLGESLRALYYWKKAVNQIIGNKDINNIMSNAYAIYNIKNFRQLYNYISIKSKIKLFIYDIENNEDARNKIINFLNDDIYIIDIKTFKFLNERIWPRIVSACNENIDKNKDNNFLLRINIPMSYVIKLYPSAYNSFFKEFIEDVQKWLTFHFLGKIKEAKDENESLLLILEIKY